jgi:hypothetical protein
MKKSPATSTARIGRIIASREFTDAKGPRRRITVSLGVPHRIRDGGWECPFSIEGLSAALISGRSEGSDSLSALFYAVGNIRQHLKESGATFKWGGDPRGDDTGIPQFLPLGKGKEFYHRVDAAINREIDRTLRLDLKHRRRKWRAKKKPRVTSHPRVGRIAASRGLTDAKNPRRRIVVALGVPRQVDFMEWECKIHIDGLEPIAHQTFGVDSMQALLLGVEALRMSLKRSPYRLAWLGDSTFYPAGGIPRQVSGDLGEEFDARIEKLIEREKEPFWEAKLEQLSAQHRQPRKRTAASGERPTSQAQHRPD